jgi:ABC-2 type transport system ATP-binding protein
VVIDVDHVYKRFGKVSVINDLCLQVPEGSAFALLGTNGAGKTTTLRLLVNIIRPDMGRATVLGVDSRALTYKDFFHIGYFSEDQKLPERLTIAQYFDYLRPLYPNWDKALEMRLRDDFYLPRDRGLSKLSHGMRMKTVLAAALAFRPKLLLLDEPLSGLDTLVRDEVVEGLLSQADETTIVISSHEVAEIENFTTHLAFMDDGLVYFQESIESMRDRFREMTVTLSNERTLPECAPASWLNPVIDGRLLRFVETKFECRDASMRQLNQYFGAVRFDEEPMTLREISKALIREARSR